MSEQIERKIVLIAAGGTGGHIFPGLAIAEEFFKRGYEPQWLGTETGMEADLVAARGIKLHFFPVSGFRGKGLAEKVKAPFKAIRAVVEARRILQSVKPVITIGMGGFVAGPAGLASFLSRIPLVIHEQNAIAGTTNRILAHFSRKILCAFPTNLRDAEVIGNPIRESFEALEKRFDRRKTNVNVLVLGGSRGARALNQNVAAAFAKAGLIEQVDIRHQCGKGRLDETLSAYQANNMNANVFEFIDDVASAFNWADLIVCRAGALTVSEVAAAGTASVMVPYPYAIDDHQTHNAKYLEQYGATIIVQETEFASGKLSAVLNTLVSNRDKLCEMSSNARKAAKKGVSEYFVDICESLPEVSA